MIIVNIKNGLGNQMFQYAFGRVLEWKYGVRVYFDMMRDGDISPLETDLDVFCIDKINEPDVKWIEPFKPFSVRNYRDKKQYIRYLYYKLRRKYQSNKLITESFPSQYMKVFNTLDVEKKYYFLGFWQNPIYFNGYESEIRKIFLPKDKSVLNSGIGLEISDSTYNTVSMHIRRGDYISSGFLEPVGLDYYYQAINIFVEKLSTPFFYIFTDDP